MFLGKLIKKLLNLLLNPDILNIISPFIYVYLVIKYGKKSWTPVQVSLAIDAFTAFLVGLRLIGSQKLRSIEKRDLIQRCRLNFLKYLIRDPIFSEFTLSIIKSLFRILRLPTYLLGLLLSILNYYRYYTYIS